ncbi:hypothetical protein J2Y48_002797 [Mycoplana sp. BE70]|nr:hypothetical protein [Mycoplana sp. BE70]
MAMMFVPSKGASATILLKTPTVRIWLWALKRWLRSSPA